VVAVWVMGGSWKAGREGLWVYGRSDCVYGIARRGDEAKSIQSRTGGARGSIRVEGGTIKRTADLCTRG